MAVVGGEAKNNRWMKHVECEGRGATAASTHDRRDYLRRVDSSDLAAGAVFLADRVLVMSPRPGQFVGEIVDLPRPRTVATTELPAFVDFTRGVRRHLYSATAIE